jgi:hypothetical protein
MRAWTVFQSSDLTVEQKNHFLPPVYFDQKSVVVVAKEIDEENCEAVIVGEVNDRNLRQANIICKALNEADSAA